MTDNGLSRDLFPDDYHCLGDNENRPVKWMAPEALLQNQYSTATDVVSLLKMANVSKRSMGGAGSKFLRGQLETN